MQLRLFRHFVPASVVFLVSSDALLITAAFYQLLSHAEIGSETIIGACALVGERKQLPGGALYLGIPAKVQRPLSETERADLPDRAARYYRYAAEHAISAVRGRGHLQAPGDQGVIHKIFRVFTG